MPPFLWQALTEVELIEVTINFDGSFTSTPVTDGEIYCIDSLDFDLVVEPYSI